MKKYALSLTLLLQFNAYATDSLSTLINKLNGVGEIACEEMTHQELAEQCLREVCGPPGGVASNVTAKNINKFLTPEQIKEFETIEAQVKSISQQRKKDYQAFINEFQKRVRDPQFSNSSNWDENDYNYFSQFFWKYIDWQVDGTKPLAQRSQLIVDESNLDLQLLAGVREFADLFNKNLLNDPLYSYEMGLTSFEELKEGIRKKSQQVQKKLAFKVKYDFSDYYTQIENGQNANDIITHFQTLNRVAQNYGIEVIENLSNCQNQCQRSINQFLKKLNPQEILSSLQNSLNQTDDEDLIAECKANFIMAKQENDLQENFQRIWPEVKKGFQQNVFPKFSSHSQQLMRNYLENDLHFYFDKPLTQDFPNLNSLLHSTPQSTALQNSPDSFILGDLMNKHFDHEMSSYQSPIRICQTTSTPTLIWDNFMSKEALAKAPSYQKSFHHLQKDNIAVSPFTCEHQKEGAGILAHELGHALSHLMSRGNMSSQSLAGYQKLRSCASAQWDLSAPARILKYPGDKQFTEEDTADIMSYMAVNDGKSIFSCGFIAVNQDETNYTDDNTEPWGEHSPSLIRVLREISYKHSSPPTSCSYLMKGQQDKLGDIKCFSLLD